jgi:hypothetical protein
MGLLENAVEGAFEGPGLLIGLGAAVAAPIVFPTAASGLRPVAKGIIRGALALSQAARGTFSEASERLSDLVAEVRDEREGAALAAVGAAKPSPPGKPKVSGAREPAKTQEPKASAEEKPPTA